MGLSQKKKIDRLILISDSIDDYARGLGQNIVCACASYNAPPKLKTTRNSLVWYITCLCLSKFRLGKWPFKVSIYGSWPSCHVRVW